MTQNKRKIRVGVSPFPEHTDVDELRRAWVEADEIGVDAIFVSDHFLTMMPVPGYGREKDARHHRRTRRYLACVRVGGRHPL